MLLQLLKVALVKRITELLLIQRRALSLNRSQRNFGRQFSYLERLRSKNLEHGFEVREVSTSAHQRPLALFAKRSSKPVRSRVVAFAVRVNRENGTFWRGIFRRGELCNPIARVHRQNLRARHS